MTKLYCIEHINATSAGRLESIYSPGNISLFFNRDNLFNLLSVSDNIRYILLSRWKDGTKLYCIEHINATSARRLESIYNPGNISLFFNRDNLFNLLSVFDNIRYILLNSRKIGTNLYCIEHINATSAIRLESVYSPGIISLFFNRDNLFNLLSVSDKIRYILLNSRKIATKFYCIERINATSARRLETIYGPGNISLFLIEIICSTFYQFLIISDIFF